MFEHRNNPFQPQEITSKRTACDRVTTGAVA